MKVIDAAFDRSRVVMLSFVMILISGALSYIAIPKESEPDIPIPTFYVSMFHEGIAPEDAERLLVRPMEQELQALEGLKEMSAIAGESHASVTLEFSAGFDPDEALLDIREKVDLARSELPPDAEEPRVIELNVALFPVISVALSGPVPERQLVNIARDLQDKIEALPGVLEAEIGGDREEMMEVVVNPSVMESYDITFQDIAALLQNNNRLIAAGAIDSGAGRMVLKVPGVIEDIDDVMNLPIKTLNETVVTFKDVVSIRRVFKDPEGFARIKGEGSVVLEVSKRLGANIIETIDLVREVIEEEQKLWPETIKVTFMQDKSVNIKDMLKDLQNNVLSAIVLVMIVVVAALGVRPAFLVGMAIPGSFLAGILLIYSIGLTINIVVLFSLILVVGMLVDGAIVTIELADRKIGEGLERAEAYAFAAKRMSWPIIASTATTLAVFFPLLFWPGMVGEFMKYLPITVLFTLMASLFMALIFIPVLGGLLGSKTVGDMGSLEAIKAAESGDLKQIKGSTGKYLRYLETLLHHPAKVLLAAIVFLIMTFVAFGTFGKGVEFFPDVEPDFIQVQVQARGDLSVFEKDKLVKRVEQRILGMDVFKSVYSRTFGNTNNQQNMPEDVIGVIQLEFINWRLRPPASEVIDNVREKLSDVAGIKVQVRKAESGPSAGKPVEVEVRSTSMTKLTESIKQVRGLMNDIGGFVDLEDSRPLPGIEWRLEIDREQAARSGADVSVLGSAVQLLTTGLKVGEYQPDDASEELDIRLRFPTDERSLEQLMQLRVPTPLGHIPVDNFVRFETAQKTGNINRVDGRRVMTIKADVEEGLLVDQQVKLLKEAVANTTFDPAVSVHFKGQDEDQKEAGDFLLKAFLTAIFMMTTILVTQFNSFYQAILVLSAIIFSTAGVLLGLLVTGNPFGIVMGGIGVIALAGIVVNNNIVLIDTFNDLKKSGMEPMEAVLRTAAQRMRPVLLTSITTILGLLPMVFAMNIDLINADIAFGAPSTQWWIQLSSAIAGGLAFATVLTLILTPCLLILGERLTYKIKLPQFLSRSNKSKHAVSIMICGIILSSCAQEQKIEHQPFNKPIPQNWTSEDVVNGDYKNLGWLADFNDEQLISLVGEALKNNYDLQTTATNLAIAAAQAKKAGANLYPQLNLTSQAGRNGSLEARGSNSSQFSNFNNTFGQFGDISSGQYGVSLDVNWEIDIWGRIRAGSQAAEYDYYAAEYDHRGAQQSIAAQTAKAYFLAIETSNQLALAQDFEKNLQETLEVTNAFYKEGLLSLQDIHLVKADLARARESVQNTKSAYFIALRSLEVLLGRYPSANVQFSQTLPQMPAALPSGIPSSVLERRPDVRAAERRIAAAFKRVKYARAAKLPSVSLTSSIGGNSDQLKTLTDPENIIWNVIGNLMFPIFNAGDLDADIDIRTAEQKSAIANYQQTALNTFLEIETALSNEALFREKQNNLNDAYKNSKAAENIADANFKAGEIELLDLLQIKRSTITTQTARITAQRELLDQRINLHLGLGGKI